MANQSFELFNEYNTKVLETMRAFGDLNVATAQLFINKQVELTNHIMETSLASGKQMAAAKTPVEAMQVSSALMQDMTDSVSGFVKDAAADAVKARDDLKAVIDDAVSMNSEYANKAFETGMETVKQNVETAKKATSKKAA
jgi:phasin family protein